MSCTKECPICMDDIMEVNYVITECGHTFHTSCLMKNAAHNGFGCPYCRTVMAEVPEEEEDEDEGDYSSSEEEDNDDELYSDHSLRGMRWLLQRAENRELDEEEEEDDEESQEENIPLPTSELIVQKLLEQEITMNDLVKCLLAINHEEYDETEEYQTKEDEIFEKIQIIISNYKDPVPTQEPGPVLLHQQPIQPFTEEVKEEEKNQIILEEEKIVIEQLDYSAQPKEKVKINYLKNRIIY